MEIVSSIFGATLGFLSAFYIGFFIVSAFLKNTELPFRVFFGIALGFGLTSVFYFLAMLLNIYNFDSFKNFEFLFLVVCGLFYYFKNEQVPCSTLKPKIPLSLGISSLFGFLISMRYFMNNTLGSWDGFRIWNIKAQFLLQNSEEWRSVFLLPHFMMHNDYPLFLPCTTARLWKYAGADTTSINCFLGLIFTFSIIYLIYFAVKKYKNKTLATACSSILALSPVFLINGASQSADVPMAFLVLCSVLSMFLFFEKKDEGNGRFLLVLSIVFAGLSAWMKNEGMMYFLLYSGVLSLYLLSKKDIKNFLCVIFSALPFLCFITLFKSVSHTPNDLYMGVVLLKTYRHIFHFSYYVFIFKFIISIIIKDFSILFLILLLSIKGFEVNKKIKTPLFITGILLILMSLGYFTVYLLSPHDLQWLLENSLARIILQITPLSVLALALILKIGQKDNSN